MEAAAADFAAASAAEPGGAFERSGWAQVDLCAAACPRSPVCSLQHCVCALNWPTLVLVMQEVLEQDAAKLEGTVGGHGGDGGAGSGGWAEVDPWELEGN